MKEQLLCLSQSPSPHPPTKWLIRVYSKSKVTLKWINYCFSWSLLVFVFSFCFSSNFFFLFYLSHFFPTHPPHPSFLSSPLPPSPLLSSLLHTSLPSPLIPLTLFIPFHSPFLHRWTKGSLILSSILEGNVHSNQCVLWMLALLFSLFSVGILMLH